MHQTKTEIVDQLNLALAEIRQIKGSSAELASDYITQALHDIKTSIVMPLAQKEPINPPF